MKLCPCIRAKYLRFYEEAKVQGIKLTTIETQRDLERQIYYKQIGSSRTLKSYHLPHPPLGLSLAFDVCPTEYLKIKYWNPGGELWEKLGVIGRTLGLGWGGDWQGWKDRPHFDLHECECEEPFPEGVTIAFAEQPKATA